MTDVILKFIAGPLQGSEFPLENGHEVVIGRSDEADLRILDETVSRKHARIFFRNDEIVIEDLSKNGTHVNSRPIRKAILMPGDLVYIGRSVLTLVEHPSATNPGIDPASGHPLNVETDSAHVPAFVNRPTGIAALEASFLNSPSVATAANPSARLLAVTIGAPQPGKVGSSTSEHFRGSIADIAMTDLLQLLSSSRKTGVIILRSLDMVGKIFMEKGQICYATMDEVEPVNPQKVFCRLLRWTEGTFEFAPPNGRTFPTRLNESVDHLLLEAMHELDEINNLGPDLPSLHAEVLPADPLPSPLKDLASGDLDFIQLAMRHKMVRDILDHYSGTDFEGYTYLKSLAGRKFLEISL
jgi:pSer/pThr/pTyr-binding forkhead associated (FHA) protein